MSDDIEDEELNDVRRQEGRTRAGETDEDCEDREESFTFEFVASSPDDDSMKLESKGFATLSAV